MSPKSFSWRVRVLIVLAALMLLVGAPRADKTSPHGQLGLDCSACHATEGWIPLKPGLQFDHSTTTFPLIGRHRTVRCRECHRSLVFKDADSGCLNCHPDVHRGQFAMTCEKCHSPESWNNQAEMYRSHQATRFPLVGVHAALDCQSCHALGQYAALSTECFSCHLDAYGATRNPDHTAAGFSTNCTSCHRTTAASWSASFEHSLTFPLVGGHGIRECVRCHQGGYRQTSSECVSCHLADFQAAQNPNHVAGQYAQNCTECHSTQGWSPAAFNHDLSAFTLTGAHVAVECALCHVNGQFAGTTTVCYDCHRAAYEGVTDPNHVAGQFDQQCTECHTTGGWTPALFDHSGTAFPLTGAHVSANCTGCHVNGRFAGTPTACYDCHRAAYEAVIDPNHVAGQFDHQCAECHTTGGWTPAAFDHSGTAFPLTGAHVTANCTGCHINGQFAGTTTACYDCHRAVYEAVTDPNHLTGQFDHQCAVCHSTVSWSPATFDHSATTFPLTGAHVSVNCTACHVNGQFSGTPTDCYFCHQNDYNTTQNPNHAAAGFPTTCADCHTTSNWNAQFDHDGRNFPIYSGRHRNEWSQCSDCHTNPNNYAIFSCIDCHAHNCPSMNQEHNEVSGYVCESQACYHCHPTGGGGGLFHKRPALERKKL